MKGVKEMKGKIGLIGGMMFVIGLGGIESAINGQGSFLFSAVVLAIGFGCSLVCLRGEA